MRQIDSSPVELAVDQRGDHPQHDADDEQDACDLVLHDRAASPGCRQEPAYDGADNRDEGRRAEVLVLDAVAPEHEDGNIDDCEDTDRKSTRLNSSHANISYAVFCLKKKKKRFYSCFMSFQTYFLYLSFTMICFHIFISLLYVHIVLITPL